MRVAMSVGVEGSGTAVAVTFKYPGSKLSVLNKYPTVLFAVGWPKIVTRLPL